MPRPLPLVAILSLLAPIGAPVHLGDGERAELVRAADPALLALRGGDGTRARIGADPRAELRRAERCSPELAGLRGGDVVLSDRDVKVILITAAAILLLIAIF